MKPDPCNLYLIGLPGVGKTTLGRALAQRLGRAFVDLDQEIVAAVGMPIPAFFAQQGEAAFRAEESRALQRLAQRGGLVVATGGGIVVRDGNVKRMRETGLVLWITRPSERVLRDLDGHSRPLLQGDARARLAALAREREPLYQGAAHHVICNDQAEEQALLKMLRWVQEQPGGPGEGRSL